MSENLWNVSCLSCTFKHLFDCFISAGESVKNIFLSLFIHLLKKLRETKWESMKHINRAGLWIVLSYFSVSLFLFSELSEPGRELEFHPLWPRDAAVVQSLDLRQKLRNRHVVAGRRAVVRPQTGPQVHVYRLSPCLINPCDRLLVRLAVIKSTWV